MTMWNDLRPTPKPTHAGPHRMHRLPMLASALIALMLIGIGCGDGSNFERVDRSQLSVRVGETNADLLTFDLTPPGQHRDTLAISVSNAGSGTLSITKVETEFDLTGYITIKPGEESDIENLPFTVCDSGCDDVVRRFSFRLAIPAPLESDVPLACPAPPADLPASVDPTRYCGRVIITSDAPEDNITSLYFQVQQSAGRIAVDPTVLTFEATTIGRAVTQEFTITNESTSGTLEIQNITKTNFTNDSSNQFVVDGFDRPMLMPGETLDYTVTYTPESLETIEGRIVIESDDPTAASVTITVQTSASGGVEIEAAPESLLFPNAAPGMPQTQEVTVTNKGSGAALTIDQMSIRPAEAGESYKILWNDRATAEDDYVAWTPGNSTDVIPRANSRVYRIVYEPLADGTSVSGTLRINTNATNVTGGIVEIPLSGNTANPDGYVSPTNIVFNVAPGESEARNFTVGNRGLAPLSITGISVAESPGTTLETSEFAFDPDPIGMSLAPGDLLAVEITHNRPANGTTSALGTLQLESNHPFNNGLLTINIQNENTQDAFSPVSRITQDPDGAVAAEATVTFDGSTSTPESGEISFYQWTLLDRPSGSTADFDPGDIANPSISLTPDIPGTYRIQLVVRNSLGLEGASVRDLTVGE